MRKTLPTDAILVPDDAKLVFHGGIFDVFQWPQQLFDGRTVTFEMAKRTDTVLIMVVRDGQLLLAQDAQPGRPTFTDLPGGRPDEEDGSWLVAAQRELREETGLSCAQWRLVNVRQPAHKVEWFSVLYLAYDITDESAQTLDPGGERIELLWKPFVEVRDEVLSGQNTDMDYLIPFFIRVKTVDELLALPAFAGKEIDR